MNAMPEPFHAVQLARLACIAIGIPVAALVFPATDALAKLPYEYAAKVVCGLQESKKNPGVTIGIYATTINVRNPNGAKSMILKYFVPTLPPGKQHPSDPIQMSQESVPPNAAFASDCHDIAARAKITLPFWEGFLVIESESSLDVVGVYTSATTGNEQSSIEVVHVPERSLRNQ